MISITLNATAEIQRMKNGRSDTKLYLTLGTGSCEQFYYALDLVEEWPTEAIIYAVNNLAIGIDQRFSKFLEAIQIDFAQDLMGGGFRFHNPRAIKVCGCGNAFTAGSDMEEIASNVFEI
jgi:iron-sulfur cluster assembly protein